jgi:D-methionine transport system substrate-binding protein
MKKKILGLLGAALIGGLILTGCGSNNTQGSSDENTLVIGASATPHSEILEHVKPMLASEGITLEIKVFDDFILPNKALAEGSIDANYFQHIPYLNQQMKDNGFDFVNAGAIHLEPMGLYSKSLKNIQDVKEGSTVLVSNSVSDWGRVISILQDAQLVKVASGTDLQTATFEDITENPKNLVFNTSLNPEVMSKALENDEAPIVAINGNFAQAAGLDPTKDSLVRESDNSLYVNIVAVRSGDENKPAVKKLIEVLHRKEVQDWILEKWGGAVVPVPAEAK